jgi:predicted N-acetyltransferase YhbS
MNIADVAYLPEQPAHDPEIEHINAEAFGPGRFARAAYKIREGGPHERALSFVAVYQGAVIASVRMTRIAAGEGRALLLGPLAVRPDHKNLGIGKKLVRISVEAARKADAGSVILVGDEPYYGPLGFDRVPRGQLSMPRPVDGQSRGSGDKADNPFSPFTGRRGPERSDEGQRRSLTG